jgi:GTP-binding nuclear protein Ran
MTTKHKIALIGNGGVGKTSYMKRLRNGIYLGEYIPTMGVEVYPITCKYYLDNNIQENIFNVFDCAGQEIYGGEKEKYWVNCTGVIMMFDLSSELSFKSIELWYNKIQKNVPKNIPIVLVGNKYDLNIYQKVTHEMINNFINKINEKVTQIRYYNLSTKTCYNLLTPFLSIINYYNNDKVIHIELDE